MLLAVNYCKLRYNFKIQYLIRFVFDCAVLVNFRPEIQITEYLIFGSNIYYNLHSTTICLYFIFTG